MGLGDGGRESGADSGAEMTTTALSDAGLLAQARQGDESAFTELYVRHQAAARRLASAYPRAGDPDDLVNAAFERVLGALRRGAGPDEAFRAYLFVTLRRYAADQINRLHDEPVDEVPEPIRAEENNPPLDPDDRQIVVSAYESLPERWQAVLWQTAVEGRQPRELAGVLGMSANAAAALAYRAREKLRQAYLQAHLQAAPRPQCEPYRSRLGAYVRDGLSRRDKGATQDHLDGCSACRELVAELIDVNSLLTRSLVPVFQSTAGQLGAAVATGSSLAGSGGAALLAKRVVSKVRSNPAVVAGVVAVAALAIAMIAARQDEQALQPEPAPEAEEEVEEAAPPADTPPPSTPPPTPDEPIIETPLVRRPGAPPSTPPTSTAPTAPPPGRAAPTTPTTTTTAPPAPTPPPPSSPPPPPPPPPPPEEPAFLVVWLRVEAALRITLTNDTGQRTDGVLVEVDLGGGARVNGPLSGCGVSLAVLAEASCAVQPLDPGETAVIELPVGVTGSGQVAATRVCDAGLLNLVCLGQILAPVTTALTL